MTNQISGKLVVDGRWTVGDLIGSGGQAKVYEAYDLWTESDVAVKINQGPNYSTSPLFLEKWTYEQVMKRCGDEHMSFIPTFHHYEKEAGTETMIIELLGPSLQSLLQDQPDLLDLETVVDIFKRSLTCLEKLHKTGMTHRDIKPDNICVGRGMNMEDIRLIDLGFCTAYIDEETGMHKPLKYGSGVTGTLPYCSLNQQIGGTATRSDDLEALCFSMMCIYRGTLPWIISNPEKASPQQEFDVALAYKSRSVDSICSGLPKLFEVFLDYVRNVGFDSDPDYAYLHKILDETAQFKSIR